MSQCEWSAPGHPPEQDHDASWRRSLLLLLRDRVERDAYRVHSDEVAAKMIDRSLDDGSLSRGGQDWLR